MTSLDEIKDARAGLQVALSVTAKFGGLGALQVTEIANACVALHEKLATIGTSKAVAVYALLIVADAALEGLEQRAEACATIHDLLSP